MRALLTPLLLIASPALASELPPGPLDVRVDLASVNLGDDCDPPAKAKANAQKADSARRICDQAALQLTIRGAERGEAQTVKIKSVTLLDDQGKALGPMTPREPTAFNDGEYRAWDERVAPRAHLNVSYKLSAPSWGNAGKQLAKTYRVQVSLEINGKAVDASREVRLDGLTAAPADVKT